MSFAFLYFALSTIALYTSTIALPHYLILSITFDSNNDVPFALTGVQEVEELSGPQPTPHDREPDGVRGSIASSPSPSEIISKPMAEPSPYQDHLPNIDSDAVPPTTRMENIEEIAIHQSTITIPIIEAIPINVRKASAFQMEQLKKSLPLWWRLCLMKYRILSHFVTVTCTAHMFSCLSYLMLTCHHDV